MIRSVKECESKIEHWKETFYDVYTRSGNRQQFKRRHCFIDDGDLQPQVIGLLLAVEGCLNIYSCLVTSSENLRDMNEECINNYKYIDKKNFNEL